MVFVFGGWYWCLGMPRACQAPDPPQIQDITVIGRGTLSVRLAVAAMQARFFLFQAQSVSRFTVRMWSIFVGTWLAAVSLASQQRRRSRFRPWFQACVIVCSPAHATFAVAFRSHAQDCLRCVCIVYPV